MADASDEPEVRIFAAETAPGEDLDLARAALLLGRIEDRALALEPWLERLDALGREVAAAAGASGGDPVAAISSLFRGERALRGNEDAYEDPRNSFLHEVLERRLGIPISLSVVAIEAGRRAGIRVEGVSFPGHFLIRVRGHEGGGSGASAGVVLDPFSGGRVLRDADLLGRLGTATGRIGSLGPAELGTATKVQILARMLRNLKAVYFKAGAIERALRVEDRMVALLPDDADERRDRGLLLARLGRVAEAEAELRAYLRAAPRAPDGAAVLEIADELRSRRGTHH